jgi:hypothetical protein
MDGFAFARHAWNLRLHRPGNIGQMDRNSTDRDKNRFHTAE